MDDLTLLGAFLWQRVGRQPAPRKVLEDILAFEVQWFRPSRAREVVDALVASGIWQTSPDWDRLTASPGLADVAIPPGWRPVETRLAPGAPASPPPPLLDRLLTALTEKEAGRTREAIASRIRERARTLSVSPEAAAILRLQELGEDTRSWRRELARQLFGEEGPAHARGDPDGDRASAPAPPLHPSPPAEPHDEA